ncbi:MAG TPA: hypothetical protein VE465_16090 [Streptosporangiaceae bacterium]|jgi:hypothetical protein|nr:hypothetical protein [Streptosporangiaceae bacterium]
MRGRPPPSVVVPTRVDQSTRHLFVMVMVVLFVVLPMLVWKQM